jgi:hypothetical protein
MRKSPTLPWRRSIPSIKKPSERGNWAYNLPTPAVAVAVDMAAVAADTVAVAADTVAAADMAAADMAAAAAGMVAVAAGIEVVAAAAAALAGAAATVAAAAACPGAVAGRPARLDLHKTKLTDALSSKPDPFTLDPAFSIACRTLGCDF